MARSIEQIVSQTLGEAQLQLIKNVVDFDKLREELSKKDEQIAHLEAKVIALSQELDNNKQEPSSAVVNDVPVTQRFQFPKPTNQ